MSDDRRSWGIKDVAICSELLSLADLTDAQQAMLHSLAPMAQSNSAAMVQAFHGRLLAHEHTKEYLAEKNVAHIGEMVAAWYEDLFRGPFDHDYARKRIAIGKTHVRIGLPVRYPIAMLDVVMKYGQAVCDRHESPAEAFVAFQKVLSIDVAIFSQAYEDNQLQHLADLVGGERLARRLLAGTDP